jgi:transcriptional regulator with XRE-family HTH domain
MKMNEKKLLGQRIKELRKSKGFSQEKLAEKAETSPNYLSRIERGTDNPTLDMLIKLANALEVEMWEMFDFGHVKSHKELKESIQSLIKTTNEPSLRLALKVIRAVSR